MCRSLFTGLCGWTLVFMDWMQVDLTIIIILKQMDFQSTLQWGNRRTSETTSSGLTPWSRRFLLPAPAPTDGLPSMQSEPTLLTPIAIMGPPISYILPNSEASATDYGPSRRGRRDRSGHRHCVRWTLVQVSAQAPGQEGAQGHTNKRRVGQGESPTKLAAAPRPSTCLPTLPSALAASHLNHTFRTFLSTTCAGRASEECCL